MVAVLFRHQIKEKTMAKAKIDMSNPVNDAGGPDTGAGEIELEGEQAELLAQAPAAPPAGMVPALVLRACGFGEAGAVVYLAPEEAECGQKQGALDLNPAAVQAVTG